MKNYKENEHWKKFITIHKEGTIKLCEAFLGGELSEEQFIEKYAAQPHPRTAPSTGRSHIRFLKKYFLNQ